MDWFHHDDLHICGIMLLPLFMVIVVQMKRMATQSHVFAYCYLTAAVSGATLFALADIFFLTAAFRPGRNPELVMLLNDMAWIIFIAPVGALVAMNLILAAASLSTTDPVRCSRAGSGYYSAGHRACHGPAVGAAIFRSGPLAWDGAVSFWLRNGSFALFVLVMFFVLRGVLHRRPSTRGDRAVSSAVSPRRRPTPSRSTPAAPARAGKRDVWFVFWIVPASTPPSGSSSSRWRA